MDMLRPLTLLCLCAFLPGAVLAQAPQATVDPALKEGAGPLKADEHIILFPALAKAVNDDEIEIAVRGWPSRIEQVSSSVSRARRAVREAVRGAVSVARSRFPAR